MTSRNEEINGVLCYLEDLEKDIDEDGKEYLETTQDLLAKLMDRKVLVDKTDESCLAKLREQCNEFENEAKASHQEINIKYKRSLKTLMENKRREEKKLHTEDNVLEEITNKMDSVALNEKALGEKEIHLKQKQNVDIERDRATFKLLSSTLKIKWDYTSSKDMVQGFVSGKESVPFSLDKKKYNNYYAANYLWDLIELSQ